MKKDSRTGDVQKRQKMTKHISASAGENEDGEKKRRERWTDR